MKCFLRSAPEHIVAWSDEKTSLNCHNLFRRDAAMTSRKLAQILQKTSTWLMEENILFNERQAPAINGFTEFFVSLACDHHKSLMACTFRSDNWHNFGVRTTTEKLLWTLFPPATWRRKRVLRSLAGRFSEGTKIDSTKIFSIENSKPRPERFQSKSSVRSTRRVNDREKNFPCAS